VKHGVLPCQCHSATLHTNVPHGNCSIHCASLVLSLALELQPLQLAHIDAAKSRTSGTRSPPPQVLTWTRKLLTWLGRTRSHPAVFCRRLAVLRRVSVRTLRVRSLQRLASAPEGNTSGDGSYPTLSSPG
jgi:hypothetical protein